MSPHIVAESRDRNGRLMGVIPGRRLVGGPMTGNTGLKTQLSHLKTTPTVCRSAAAGSIPAGVLSGKVR